MARPVPGVPGWRTSVDAQWNPTAAMAFAHLCPNRLETKLVVEAFGTNVWEELVVRVLASFASGIA